MAVIQKIRERYAKLAGFVIALSLVAFIVSEGLNGSFRGLFGGNDNSVAKVNGTAIDALDYSKMVQDYQSLSELFRKGQAMNETEQAQLRQQVLQEMVNEQLMLKEVKKLGLQVTKQEENDMFYSADPDPNVKQFPYFTNQQTGAFDPQMVKEFERQVKKDNSAEAQRAASQWEALKKILIRSRLMQKYGTLVSSAVYTPKFLAARSQADQQQQVGFRYVKIPFTAINDNDVKVTDADMKAYMEKHKSTFEVDQPTRSIDYVVFDVLPNAEDTAQSLGELNKVRGQFETTTDNEAFVNRYSETRYNDAYVTKNTMMSTYADSILSLAPGAVYGPYFENNTFKLTKVISKTVLPDSVKVRHILVKTEDQGKPVLDSNIAKARIDSIASAIRGGADFKAMVAKYSDDQGSKSTGGEYEFPLAQRSGISTEFGDFIFEGKTGDKKVVKVSNGMYAGYHYIEILSQRNPLTAAKVATVAKSLNIGSRADQTIIARANEFAGKNNTGKAFDEAVRKQGLNVRKAEDLKPGDYMIPGLGAAREIIRWAFEAKQGDVSNPMHLENKYLVAKVAAVQDKGMKVLDAATKGQVETIIRMNKKADMIEQKYKGQTSLEAIGQAAGQPVQTADSINATGSFVPNLGYEPKVIGYAFYPKYQPNTLSPALKGRDGVYYINLMHRYQSTAPANPMGMQQQAQMEEMQSKNFVSSQLQEVLRRRGEVTYKPQNIY